MNALPTHPLTDARALGFRANGQPIFPIFGADESGATALDDPRLTGLSESDRRALAPLVSRSRELSDDFARAEAEIESISSRYGTEETTMPAGQAQRLDNLKRRMRRIGDEIIEADEKLERRARLVGQVRESERTGRGLEHIGNGPEIITRHHANPWAGLEPGIGDSPSGLRARAQDMTACVADVPQASRTVFAEAIAADREPQALLARWALATSRDAYRSAFAKIIADSARGHMLWTPEERRAWADADVISRAMGEGSNGTGGYMVPFMLDPSVMLTSAGTISAVRRLARTETIASNAWHGVSSAGVTAEWLAEADEAADGSPALDGPSVPAHKLSAFVPFSVELEADQPLLGAELQKLLTDAADVLTAEAFASGDGTGKPTGITVGIGPASQISVGTADTLTAADVYGLQNALPPRWQQRAAFVAGLPTINTIAALETGNGAKVFPEVANGQLLRRPLEEDSNLADIGATSGAGNDSVAIYGSLRDGYLIAQQVGTRIEYVQHVFGPNGRPRGQRGLWLWMRTGGDVINSNALRILTA